ncbi:hypothetical protein C6Q28_06300 [Burkholderia multivorans]|uniref:Uncharacterized protein n=3 Tax=Burkholderia cepacia complex TaxID=87882 RepID=A0A0H3KPW6_BURM1|nr:hypothetical protein Bcep1808_4347 [Burkholderia vietnamiensis G4]OXH89182.1 hypothetical protein CA831_14750 [Burkholderia multivorans]BAG45648.1 unique hypothetical protein [Burkholderia multivorans ATCC 17616]OXH93251.1 hypothetical protein CA830_08730 [Burkholderia multivorans]PRE96883.1 hypothetical protein C6Q07_31800 [Burkholderia multivorans]
MSTATGALIAVQWPATGRWTRLSKALRMIAASGPTESKMPPQKLVLDFPASHHSPPSSRLRSRLAPASFLSISFVHVLGNVGDPTCGHNGT